MRDEYNATKVALLVFAEESDELAYMRSIWDGRLAIMALKNCLSGPLCGALGGRWGEPPFGLLPLGSASGRCCEGTRPDTLTLHQGSLPLRLPHKMSMRDQAAHKT